MFYPPIWNESQIYKPNLIDNDMTILIQFSDCQDTPKIQQPFLSSLAEMYLTSQIITTYMFIRFLF